VPPEIKPEHRTRVEAMRRLSELLDSAFRVPGTKFRFGWDPLLGLVPGIGDAVTALFACALLVQAFQMRIPKIVQVRMLLNVLIDVLVGSIPFVGDLFDFAWKSNAMNLKLIERHAYEVSRAKPGDWAFVVSILAVVVITALIPVVLLWWLLSRLGRPFV
jgi:NAD/NADP transhydrogenase beta subunit